MSAHTCTHAHTTRMHACMHARRHTHTHTCMHACMHAGTHTYTRQVAAAQSPLCCHRKGFVGVYTHRFQAPCSTSYTHPQAGTHALDARAPASMHKLARMHCIHALRARTQKHTQAGTVPMNRGCTYPETGTVPMNRGCVQPETPTNRHACTASLPKRSRRGHAGRACKFCLCTAVVRLCRRTMGADALATAAPQGDVHGCEGPESGGGGAGSGPAAAAASAAVGAAAAAGGAPAAAGADATPEDAAASGRAAVDAKLPGATYGAEAVGAALPSRGAPQSAAAAAAQNGGSAPAAAGCAAATDAGTAAAPVSSSGRDAALPHPARFAAVSATQLLQLQRQLPLAQGCLRLLSTCALSQQQVCTRVCMCVYVSVCIRTHARMHMCGYVCVCVCVLVRACLCLNSLLVRMSALLSASSDAATCAACCLPVCTCVHDRLISAGGLLARCPGVFA